MDSPVDFRSLAGEWGVIQAQELSLVSAGLRDACRMRGYRDDLPRLAETARRLSLKMLVGFNAVRVSSVPGRAGFSEWGRAEALTPHRRECSFVYFARDHVHGQRLRRYDEAVDHRAVGELLGYPDCCARSFSERSGGAKAHDPVLLTYTDAQPIPWLMNVSLLCFGHTVLSHVPCSPSCRKSEELAAKYFRLIAELSPDFADELKRVLSSRVLHTSVLGVAAFTADEREGGGLQVRDVRAADDKSVLGSLVRSGSLLRREEDGVSVNGCLLAGEQVRLFHFV